MRLLHLLDPNMDLADFVSNTIIRLLLACFLGGIIGLERELKHKPAGLRTNMFICFGAAMFTILSFRYSIGTTDRMRVAAQIIPGIGFIGAGSILHSKNSVSGLTTAATLFVVASIGMAVGGGEFLSAIFATLVILVALNFLGFFEKQFRTKTMLLSYVVTAKDLTKAILEVNGILRKNRMIMQAVSTEKDTDDGMHRLQFSVEAPYEEQNTLAASLRDCLDLQRVETLRGTEQE